MKQIVSLSALSTSVFAIQNGKGITPVIIFILIYRNNLFLKPMGWRSWNLFGGNVNQELIQSQVLIIFYIMR
jgi:hypothetical protein